MSVTYKIPTGLCDEMIDPTLPKSSEPGPLYGLNLWLQGALAQEPDDQGIRQDPSDAGSPIDLTKRGPVTRWIGYAFGNPRILPSEAAELLPLEPGDPNPFFQIVDAVEREGGTLRVGSSPLELATAENVTREEWQKPGYAQAAVLVGGDCENMQVYFEVADITDEVPASFPNRTWMDGSEDQENPIETVHTWTTWYDGMPGHDPIEIDGTYYCSSANTWDGGRPLKANEWVPAGLTVKTAAEVQALQQA